MYKTVVVIPNWNGESSLEDCIKSLLSQTEKSHIIVVDNGSIDGSLNILKQYDQIEVIENSENRGYAGGVNQGFKRAIELRADYVAPFNNDAIADKKWLWELTECMGGNRQLGIVTSKILDRGGKSIDSTGDYYTVWGLPYPRGRGEPDINKYDDTGEVFGASGGASLYRVSMLEEIGLFDEAFFAYYEDVDLSFRAQLSGWKVRYTPKAIVYHQIGATSGKIKGFTTYQTIKNLPLLFVKNVPGKYIFKVGWRFTLSQCLFFISAVFRGHAWVAIKGSLASVYYLPGALRKRRIIQKNKNVSDQYIWSVIIHDLPPNALSLRKARSYWWRIRGLG
ncbi:MAG TPA: glycosyltransferase family 2 protein [Candidatus Sulfotelmatobacter sp.]|nr:glycosyltransferase family 2 protein [Candidatus Sulfotelmatobacter sp.]